VSSVSYDTPAEPGYYWFYTDSSTEIVYVLESDGVLVALRFGEPDGTPVSEMEGAWREA
jgi:hypothetical protein